MAVGFADWARQTHTTANKIIDFSQVISAAQDSALTYCGDYPYLDFSIKGGGTVNYYDMQVNMYDDAAGTIETFSTTFAFYGNTLQTIELPAIGKYVKFGITPKLSSDSAATSVYVRGSISPHAESWPAQGAAPLIASSPVIAASSTDIIMASNVSFGPATFFTGTDAATAWHADLQYYDFSTGLYVTYLRFTSAANGQYVLSRVSLPAAPVRLIVTNDDSASSVTFYVSLTAG